MRVYILFIGLCITACWAQSTQQVAAVTFPNMQHGAGPVAKRLREGCKGLNPKLLTEYGIFTWVSTAVHSGERADLASFFLWKLRAREVCGRMLIYEVDHGKGSVYLAFSEGPGWKYGYGTWHQAKEALSKGHKIISAKHKALVQHVCHMRLDDAQSILWDIGGPPAACRCAWTKDVKRGKRSIIRSSNWVEPVRERGTKEPTCGLVTLWSPSHVPVSAN